MKLIRGQGMKAYSLITVEPRFSEFQDAEFVGVTAGQSYTFDASPYLKDATAYTCLLYTSTADLHRRPDRYHQGEQGD